MQTRIFAILLLTSALILSCSQQNLSLVRYVDPFIGTEGAGNTFPGATLPFGMVKLGPDCGNKDSNSGYIPGAPVHGFSHTHVSGTGGGPKYGNILVMPFTGDFKAGEIVSGPEHAVASPGYFAVDLAAYQIHAELTVSHGAGLHRYTFPADTPKGILIDAGSFLGEGHCCGEAQELVGSETRIVSDTRIEGHSCITGGWNMGGDYTVYFVAIFDTPAMEYGVWKNNQVEKGGKIASDNDAKTGAFFIFDPTKNNTINLRVGISFISTEKAYQNLQEIEHLDFDLARAIAEQEWERALNKIKIDDENEELKTVFYSALYHTMLMPTDRTGENPKWESDEPYYDDYYAIWDTYRVTHPLLTLIEPERQVGMVRSLIDIYEHEGYMPDARSGNASGRTQGGSNCDVLIADAFVKGLEGIDYEKGLQAMIKDAEVPPGVDHQKYGRGGIDDFNTLGYVSTNHERAGSRTVEYAYNDFCIYEVAKGLGKEDIAKKYLQRSGNWKNLWKPVTDSGATGFIMPKNANGNWDDAYKGRRWTPDKGWQPAEFTVHNGGTWQDFFYEANSWEYSFYAPQNVAGLVNACGGRDAFEARLDTFFVKNYYNVGNEPSFLTPCLYNYIGRQDKTNTTIRNIIEKYFTAKRNGIPGNDDSGSMSAWVIFNTMGFFPNAGQDVYLITSPHFSRVSLELGHGKVLQIVAHGLTEENIYIQKVSLNGKPLDRSWFRHEEIKNGGKLEFMMGDQTNNAWERELPPSTDVQ